MALWVPVLLVLPYECCQPEGLAHSGLLLLGRYSCSSLQQEFWLQACQALSASAPRFLSTRTGCHKAGRQAWLSHARGMLQEGL